MIPSGELRNKVNIQSASVTKDSAGGIQEAWTTVHSPWAKLEALSGKEMEVAKQVRADINYRITIRYYSGLTSKHRITWNNKTFNIVSIQNPGERNEDHIILAVCSG